VYLYNPVSVENLNWMCANQKYKRNKMTYVILLHIYVSIYLNMCTSWGSSVVVLYIIYIFQNDHF